MALTQDEWYDKLRSWVPSWFFERPIYQVAYFKALAATLAQAQADAAEHLGETFLLQGTEPFLDAQGDERSVDRLTLEADDVYARRVQRLVAQVDKVSIKAIVDGIIRNAECKVIEGWEANYCVRETFMSRDEYLTDYRYNAFTIVTPANTSQHEPYSFCDREAFCDREDWVGTVTLTEDVYASIVAALNQAKALGTLYRIVESKR
jgi:hypothetical protein